MLSLNFCLLQVFLWLIHRLSLFKNAGFSVVDRGFLLSGSAFVAVLGQILAGYICDHIQKLRPVYVISYVLLTLGSILLFCFQRKAFFYTCWQLD